MSKELTHIPFDEFAANLSELFDRVVHERETIIVARNDGTSAVLKPLPAPKMQRASKIHLHKKTEADYAAFFSAAGSWKDLIDAEAFKEEIAAGRGSERRPVIQ
ncbi:MAG: type II toxin-antitoxin system Phd/YefM family antitoxin [Chloroflexi bacterium]|nr:type II toxin-antitoxin system Phd/YefM family antitoxin [Chloroflexota bacterium]